MRFKKVLLCLFTSLATIGACPKLSYAQMGLFVEPGIQYETGNSELAWPSPYDSADGRVKGFGVGLKAGAHLLEVLFAGLDVTASRPRYRDGNIEVYSNSYTAGAVLGAQMPIVGLRVWGEYIFASMLEPDLKNDFDLKFKDGTGYKVGAGFKLFMVSLNLEYQMITYKGVAITTPIPTSTKADLDRKTFIAGVSFPLAL
jgi:hypothetical protein